MRPLIASRESRKSPLVPAAFFVFAALAAWKLAGFIASGDTDSLIYALLIFIGSAITLTILRDWRRGLYLFLAWLVFEDFPEIPRKQHGHLFRQGFSGGVFVFELVSCMAAQTSCVVSATVLDSVAHPVLVRGDPGV